MSSSHFGPIRFLRLFAVMIVGCVLPPVTTPQAHPSPTRIVDFQDVAEKAGLTMMNVFGGVDTKKYIIETTGTGVAIFDYDNDGWPDIFIVNGTTLEGFSSSQAPTNHLYRNNHDGTFTRSEERRVGKECRCRWLSDDKQ